MYQSSSEFVSTGHPDRVCDVLAAIVIDDIQKKDGAVSHAAIEVALSHDSVMFYGEATTSLKINRRYLKSVVKRGFEMCGYIPEMRKFWKKNEVVLADDLKIVNKICPQSPDIALGTTNKGEQSGWNDQGVYFSSSDNTNSLHLGTPMFIAKQISDFLFAESRASIIENRAIKYGPDNKVVVTCSVKDDGYTPVEVTAITIAVSHSADTDILNLITEVRTNIYNLISHDFTIAENCEWVINGTGRFVIHGCISDSSLTGRKISVNHPSAGPLWSNKMIGGGSLVKPWHASDLLLNVASRYVANCIVASGLSKYAVVGCAGAIGQTKLQSLFIKGDYKFEHSPAKKQVEDYFLNHFDWSPISLANRFNFFSPYYDFAQVVKNNFFGNAAIQPWEAPRIDDLSVLRSF